MYNNKIIKQNINQIQWNQNTILFYIWLLFASKKSPDIIESQIKKVKKKKRRGKDLAKKVKKKKKTRHRKKIKIEK
jgi:hypothetical protein